MSMIACYLSLPPGDLNHFVVHPDALETMFEEELNDQSDRFLDIDKAWHAIHFLLNHHPWEGDEPLCNVVLGGVEIPEIDMGYGPPRYLTPDQVRRVSVALEGLSVDELWQRFDVDAFRQHQIYGSFQGNEEDRKYICGNFKALKTFFFTSAMAGDAMLLYMS